ncbi:MAG: hypothetical protein U5L98_18365 [Halomonas sp.]|uniref:hypothetical protein n=1 Tax=Halomonas sp. TaxID=1486246 RepID=UPI002ACEACAE|nr:hypothetical protein [Halomonas sp.]MDZ7854537.1 hypothetical protein [Halomonas sp.]
MRSDLFWLDSDDAAQGEMELAGINLEYVRDTGTLGLMYLEGLDIDEEAGMDHRDGQETWSLRWQGNAGVEDLFLSGELVDQRHGQNTPDDANAWYLEVGWTFADAP